MPSPISDDKLADKRAKRAAYMRQWRADNPERWAAVARQARKKWKAEHRDEHRESQRENRKRVRLDILNILGDGRCCKCGFTDWRALQIDHKDGGGYSDGRTKQNLHWLRSWIMANLEQAKQEYQVLCANCNWIKRHENEEFPDENTLWKRKA